MNLSKNAKITRHSNAVAAGTSTITPSSGIDMANFESCIFIVSMGTITASAVTSIEVHASSDDGASDSYTALTGTNVAIAADDDNQVFYVEVHKPVPSNRYLKCIVNRATANAVLDGIIAIQTGAKKLPVTHDSTTVGGGELHVSPAEGTA